MTTKFQKGKSGNPAGKKPGTTDKRTEYRELFQEHAPELIKVAVNMAKAGDATALKICLDRIAPALKPTTEPVNTGLPTTGTLDEQAAKIFNMAADGTITEDDASSLMSLITAQCRIKEMTDLEARMQAIENQIKELPNGKFRK